jgi:hypothetical protein
MKKSPVLEPSTASSDTLKPVTFTGTALTDALAADAEPLRSRLIVKSTKRNKTAARVAMKHRTTKANGANSTALSLFRREGLGMKDRRMLSDFFRFRMLCF